MTRRNYLNNIVIFIIFFTITSFLLGVGPFKTQEETPPSVSYQNEANSTQQAQSVDEESIKPTQSADEKLSKAIDNDLFWMQIVGKVIGIICIMIGLYMFIKSGSDVGREKTIHAACFIAAGSVCWIISILLNCLQDISPTFSAL